jgi:DnaK suppressor protein
MDKSLQETFRARIEARIDELNTTLASTKEDTAAISPDVAIGRLSRLDSMQMQQMAMGMQARMREEIKQLKEALQRIDRGRYGTCDACRQDIPIERLEFQLDATICVACLRKAQQQ